MKLKKLTTSLILGGIIAFSWFTSVSAAERLIDLTDIEFTPTSVMFTFDNRPNVANLHINCYYQYVNVHGTLANHSESASKNNAVMIQHEMFTKNQDYKSKYAKMTMYENGFNIGYMPKSYNN